VDDEERLQRLRTLTPEQRAILPLLCRQQSRRAIAEQRSMSVAGVDYHCTQLARKLGLQEGIGRRNPVEFRLALLEFLPYLLQLDAEPLSPAAAAEDAAAKEPGATPGADPAVLALVDQLPTLARHRPGEIIPCSPPVGTDDAGGAGPTARQALRRWWQPLAVLLLLALVAGVAGGVAAAHVVGGVAPATAASAATSAGAAPTPALAVATATPSTTASSPTMAALPTSTATTSPVAASASLTASTSHPLAGLPGPQPVTATPQPVPAPVDLAGKVASDFPGTPLTSGSAVSSIIDAQTKPRDVYALQLTVGQRLQVDVVASAPAYRVTLEEPGMLPGNPEGIHLCSYGNSCTATVPIAATATYRLVLDAADPGIRYTLRPQALPPTVAPGQRNLAGAVASDLPGTPLGLGATVVSIIDVHTKPVDVYAVALTAGQTLMVNVTASDPAYRVLLAPPESAPFAGHLDALHGVPLCTYGQSCQQRFAVATSGTYGLILAAEVAAIQYTLQATAQ
jgi:DNA-binding CsgD family transcriptional regulator